MELRSIPGIEQGRVAWGTPPTGKILAFAQIVIKPTVDSKLWYSRHAYQVVTAWIFDRKGDGVPFLAEVTSVHAKDSRTHLWVQKSDFDVLWWRPVTGSNKRPRIRPMTHDVRPPVFIDQGELDSRALRMERETLTVS